MITSICPYVWFDYISIGISGIIEEVCVIASNTNISWRAYKSFSLSYIAGLIASGYLIKQFYPQLLVIEDHSNSHLSSMIIVGGILVGLGSRISGGCTTGHGVCGLARLSFRSLIATVCFMFTGAIGAFLNRFIENNFEEIPKIDHGVLENIPIIIPSVLTFGSIFLIFHQKKVLNFKEEEEKENNLKNLHIPEHMTAFLCSFLFGIGLTISGMCNRHRVTGFLDFSGPDGWDPTLMGVMGGGVILNLITFNLFHLNQAPVFLKTVCGRDRGTIDSILKIGSHPDNLKIDGKLINGSLLFGLGWGLVGVCPGPALVALGASSKVAMIFVPSMLFGIALKGLLF